MEQLQDFTSGTLTHIKLKGRRPKVNNHGSNQAIAGDCRQL